MKLIKKVGIGLLALTSGVTFGFAGSKNVESVGATNEEQEVVLPNSITNRLYYDARTIKDSPYYVDKALLNWLNDDSNLEGIEFFENRPDAFGEAELRKSKDYYYVCSYLVNYIFTSYIDLNAKDAWGMCPLSYDLMRMVLDHVLAMKEKVKEIINYENDTSLGISIENFYDDVCFIYDQIKDVMIAINSDYYQIYHDEIKRCVSDAKISLRKAINSLKEKGYDESTNYFVNLRRYIDFFNNASKSAVGPYQISASYEKLENLVFDSKIDTIFNRGYLDFTLTDFEDAISGLSTIEEQQPVALPYLEKMKTQFLAYYVGINELVRDFLGNLDIYRCFMENYGPLAYKATEFIEAIWNKDYPNIMIQGFDILDDIDNLIGITFGTELENDEYKLAYAKYLANVRLGSVIPGYENADKYAKFNFVMDKINKVNLIEFDSLNEAKAEIDNLVEEGYKFINLDLVSSNENVPLLATEGIEECASKTQRYEYEVKRMVNHDHAFPLVSLQPEDYGDNLVLVQNVFLDFVLTDVTAGTNIDVFDNRITTVLGIYNFEINEDVNIYRYDEASGEAVKLSNEPNLDGEYFEVVASNIIIHSKNMGSYCISYINRLIKNDYIEFRNKISELNTKVTNLNNQISNLNNQITTLNGTVAEKQAAIESLNAEIATLQTEVNSLKAEVSGLKATNETQKASINNLTERLNTVSRSLEQKVAEIETQNETIKHKNTLNIIFIIIACVMAVAAITFAVLYILKRKQVKAE